MKKYLMFIACSLIFGFTATAFGADPNSTLPPLKLSQSTLPLRACDCQPCICDPATCACPGCANGCRKVGSASGDTTYEVGMVDAQSTLPQIPRTVQPTGYHYEQRCENGVCRMVVVADAPQAKPMQAGSICPCCGMVMNAEQAAKASVMAPVASNYTTPVTYAPMYSTGSCADGSCGTSSGGGGGRRLFGRFRRGGGCGG